MNNETIREKFNYTQRPENPRVFLAAEMANALEITLPTFYTLARKLNLDCIKKRDKTGRLVMYFSHNALGICRAELEQREAKKKKNAPKVAAVELQTEHPLVKDARCLSLNYWPDIMPVCFAEVD